nr:hypothetical protein [Acetobacter fallax]
MNEGSIALWTVVTTMYAVRTAVQRSRASLTALSEEFGINPGTVAT